MISAQTSTEIYELFELLEKDNKSRIPQKFWELVEKKKYQSYDKLQIRKNLANGIMNKETRSLYAALKLKYLCDEDLEKKLLLEIYQYNEENKKNKKENTHQINMNENIFENIQNSQEENVKMIEYQKERWYEKIFSRILEFFRKNKNDK